MDPNLSTRLYDRLRSNPAGGTVPGSLPVLFFGDLPRARVATIGINPSRQEYLSAKGTELCGELRRFETLGSLGALDRASLTASQADRAIETMRGYFSPTKPVYSWFRPLARVLEGFGSSFANGDAAHLDLVQEATDPVWSGLRAEDPTGADALLRRDLEFLRWQLEAFELKTVICTSRTVLDHVQRLVTAKPISWGTMARIRWTVSVGRVNGRAIGVVGWNIPLVRPTGLDATGQVQLGALLRDRLLASEAA